VANQALDRQRVPLGDHFVVAARRDQLQPFDDVGAVQPALVVRRPFAQGVLVQCFPHRARLAGERRGDHRGPHAQVASDSHDDQPLAVLWDAEVRHVHDLRAEVLLELLHETPPPTLAASYALAISAAPRNARPGLYRRAATRVLDAAHLETISSVRDRLAAAHRVVEPIVRSIAGRVGELSLSPNGLAAIEIAGLVDAAERLDVAAYAAASIAYIEGATPPTVDVSTYYFLAYSSRFSAIFEGNEMFSQVVAAGEGLPDWDSSARRAALAQLTDATIAQVLTETELDVAVRFSERLEGYRTIPAALVGEVYASHLAAVTDIRRVDVADLLAQLLATLAVVSELFGPAVQDAFGPVEQRAQWAAEVDGAGKRVEVALSARDALPSSASNLARASTYSADAFCEVSAKVPERPATVTVRRGYRPQPGQDPGSVNAQAVFLAQRLFDACPEADVVSVEVFSPGLLQALARTQTDGIKRMRAGVVPRRVTTERSVAVQVAVMELLSAERWTDRCRRQATVSKTLVDLLSSLPARLVSRDSARGRREWIESTISTASQVARLPGLPVDLLMIERMSVEFPFAADFDLSLRDAMRDPSKDALDLIAQSLLQVARGLSDPSLLRGAGSRLAGAAEALAAGRADGTLPEYAGLGPLLPVELDELSTNAARALSSS